MNTKNNQIPFAFDIETQAFQRSLSDYIRALADHLRTKVFPPENFNTFNHGVHWQSHNSDQPDQVAPMMAHTTAVSLKFRDLIDNNLEVLFHMCDKIAQSMHETLMRSMYQTVSESTERTGNTVSAEKGRSAEAFLEMLKKIEFGVDKNGDPTIPQLHAAPQTADALTKELSNQGPEFGAEVERIKAEKIAQALEKESARRARFVRNNE